MVAVNFLFYVVINHYYIQLIINKFSAVLKTKLFPLLNVDYCANKVIKHESNIFSKLTSQYLQIYWNRMKKTMVPDYSVKSFDGENIMYNFCMLSNKLDAVI